MSFVVKYVHIRVHMHAWVRECVSGGSHTCVRACLSGAFLCVSVCLWIGGVRGGVCASAHASVCVCMLACRDSSCLRSSHTEST